ncbi:gluconate 2-dehydrogenase subunit 3 family protein [bacterium]|nr:gluconate 2-dehydrogenase subunit 3 family protein [bacterium]
MTTSALSADATIAQIVAVVLPDFPPLQAAVRAGVQRDVAAYVGRQVAAQPPYLRMPLRLALAGFQLLPILRHARPFAALSAAQQAAYLAAWAGAPLAPMRDLVKLIRGTALWVYFDHPAVLGRLPASAPAGGGSLGGAWR